ncbi:MAG: hypothetical protein CL623_00150 [Arcobacter sp.]|nr:hypothetical protein [Arcobacter sp.]|tara:strand:+ start:317 stop:637 length:321 start_codon:yes stop_codon:yes gene_type:complete
MHNIKYSNKAYVDIVEAIDYIASTSKINALDYLVRYEEKIELLRSNPYMGIECKNKLIKRDCRIIVHESHIIIYKVLNKEKEILIIRIFHSSVDYASKVNNEKINK